MSELEFIQKCRKLVADYFNEHVDKTDDVEVMRANDVYVVWYCKTLQNHKALLATPTHDGMYYEITYNGDKEEWYLDAYKKFDNRVVKER